MRNKSPPFKNLFKKTCKFKIIFFFINIIIPIFLGILIYYIRGVGNLEISKYISPISSYRINISNNIVFNLLMFNLPDALWLYAFLSCIILIWNTKKQQNLMIFLVYIIAISLEFAQYFNLLNGTFDIIDIIFYTITIIFIYIKNMFFIFKL